MGSLRLNTCQYNGEFYYVLPDYASGETIGKVLNRTHTTESKNKYAIWKRVRDKKDHLDEIYDRQNHFDNVPAFRQYPAESVSDMVGRLSRRQTVASLARSAAAVPVAPRSASPSCRFIKASYTTKEIQGISDRLYRLPTFSTWVRSVDLSRDPRDYYEDDSEFDESTEDTISHDETDNEKGVKEKNVARTDNQNKPQSHKVPKVSQAKPKVSQSGTKQSTVEATKPIPRSVQFELKKTNGNNGSKAALETVSRSVSASSSSSKSQSDVTSLESSTSSSASSFDGQRSAAEDKQPSAHGVDTTRSEIDNERDTPVVEDYDDDDFEDDEKSIVESKSSNSSSEISHTANKATNSENRRMSDRTSSSSSNNSPANEDFDDRRVNPSRESSASSSRRQTQDEADVTNMQNNFSGSSRSFKSGDKPRQKLATPVSSSSLNSASSARGPAEGTNTSKLVTPASSRASSATSVRGPADVEKTPSRMTKPDSSRASSTASKIGNRKDSSSSVGEPVSSSATSVDSIRGQAGVEKTTSRRTPDSSRPCSAASERATANGEKITQRVITPGSSRVNSATSRASSAASQKVPVNREKTTSATSRATSAASERVLADGTEIKDNNRKQSIHKTSRCSSASSLASRSTETSRNQRDTISQRNGLHTTQGQSEGKRSKESVSSRVSLRSENNVKLREGSTTTGSRSSSFQTFGT
ncbi:serine-rich adhesin for platelets-like [Lineus longissimus]|uniref:serine-rich adhesin for platelets-like n=1 Tax=Lineus longissimus TaxID=88925 RepID=UPI00315CCA62